MANLCNHAMLKDRRKAPLVRNLIITFMLLFVVFTSTEAQVDESPEADKEQSPEEAFLFMCSGGEVDKVRATLAENPSFARAITKDGETCLHLTAISGSAEIAEAVIKAGADLNARATCEECLRMTPLSWLTYGGKVELVELLLKAGADVNMTFDGFEEGELFTVKDVALRFSDARKEGTDENADDPFAKTLAVINAHGGKTYEEMSEL